MHDGLDGGEDILLGHEAHLDVELIELQAAVGAQVLVPEAGGDLEVAVEARHHQQLLELLGRLRKGVEGPRVHPGRHQEVPGAFRRRSRQDGGLVLQEALLDHPVADRVDDLRAQDDVPVEGLAPQVEIAVLEPDLFRVVRLAEDRQGQLGGLGQDLDGAHAHLDLAGGEVRVHGLGRPGDHLAVNADDALRAQALDGGEARGLGREDQLGQAVVVAEVHEDQAAMVALAIDPPRQANGLAGVGGAQGAAGVGAIGVHGVERAPESKARKGACKGRKVKVSAPRAPAEADPGAYFFGSTRAW